MLLAIDASPWTDRFLAMLEAYCLIHFGGLSYVLIWRSTEAPKVSGRVDWALGAAR